MTTLRPEQLKRRQFVKFLGGITPFTLFSRFQLVAATVKKPVRIVEFSPSGVRTGVVEVEKVEKPIAAWMKHLTPEQFAIARPGRHRSPGSGKYANNHDDGLYHCICCNTVLFDSKTKFESGTGLPSFWQPVAKENVSVRKDMSLGMQRDEVLCTRCDTHLGHVFDDGPPPTHLRYCMNSASLNFAARRKA